MEQEKWLRWERASSITPLFIPFEAGKRKMAGYFGSAWPKTVLIYTGQNVVWRNRWSDLYNLGQKLISFFSKKGQEKKYWADWQKETKKLERGFEEVEKADLRKLSDKDLISLFNKFVEVYKSWWKYGWASTPIALQAERLLTKQGLNEKDFNYLLAPPQKSFAAEIEEDLANIGAVAKKEGLRSSRTREKIKHHTSNYFWKRNNYLETTVLTEKEIKLEIKQLLKTPQVKVMNTPAVSLESLKEETKSLANLLSNFAYYKDYRKKYQMIAGYYLDKLLMEVGQRAELSIEEMRYVLPIEVGDVLEKKISKKEIKNRQDSCLIIYGRKVEVYTGSKAKEKETEIFGRANFTNLSEIRGWGASLGLVQGKARVIMDPKDARLIKKGEILITAMTSPDFIIAMKKSAAVVTDWGGITSHAAIVSRELGIPCIVGTNITTKVFKDGDRIEVNAFDGIVRKV